MRCALVFYFGLTIFVVVYGLPDLCVFKDYGEKSALCGTHDVEYILDFIPPISQHITQIDLRGQPLKQLPENAFRNISSQSNISRIELAHCHISYVDAGALLYLYNLTFIDLSYNNIKQIDSKLFTDNKRINFIDLAHNKIEVLPKGLFQNWAQLEVIYLDHNQMRLVEKFPFKNTLSLQLYGNPWRCNCELVPTYEFLSKTNQLNQYGLVCEEPCLLRGRKWSDISRDELVCRSEDEITTEDSVMTSAEPVTTTEQDDNVHVTDSSETRYQPIDTGIAQSSWNMNWILCTLLGLALVLYLQYYSM